MVKAMKYREVQKALLSNGCTLRTTKGSHEKWDCPCGQHWTIVAHHAVVSPGVVRSIVKALPCIEEGWLQ